LFWAIFGDGSNFMYYTSPDGVTWTLGATNSGIIRALAPTNGVGVCISIYYDPNTGYFHYAVAGDSLMYHRSGTPNADGTITWNGSETAFAPVSLFGAETSCHYPSIAVDSNGYVYIAYMYYIGMNAPRVTRSGNNDGTWGATAWTYCL
jgi:hypothetical protein